MKLTEYIKNPWRIILALGNHGLVNWLPDKVFISLAFRARMNRKLDWNNLKTFNEKLQWIKMYDRKSTYTTYVDKYEVRKYISDSIGGEFLVPLYGVWNSAKEINFDGLPDEFVIKCTHDGGSVFICSDRTSFDREACRKSLKKALKKNFYWHSREWPYKNVKPRIIAEKLLKNYNGKEIVDYKLQCFNGRFDNTLVCIDRFSVSGVKYYYFDRNWKVLPYSIYEGNEEELRTLKPQNYEKMIELAESLSKDLYELRVDFYEVNGQIYFGELTFFSSGGCDTTITEAADKELGDKLYIPYKGKNR